MNNQEPTGYRIQMQDFTLYRGDSSEFALTIKGLEPSLFDQANFAMHIKPIDGRGVIAATIRKEAGRLIISLPSDATASITWQKAIYDVQMTAGEFVRTILRGNFYILADVTR